MRLEPEKFRNYYSCPCGEQWNSTWSSMCNEKCSACNKEIEPIDSDELCLTCGVILDNAWDGRCETCGEPIKGFSELQRELQDGPTS